MEITRQMIIDEALSWVGTPYHPGACLKGVGADCTTLLVGVAKAIGLLTADFTPALYHAQAYENSPREFAYEQLLKWGGTEISVEVARPGDVLLAKMPHQVAHGHAMILVASTPRAYVVQAMNIPRSRDKRNYRLGQVDQCAYVAIQKYCGYAFTLFPGEYELLGG